MQNEGGFERFGDSSRFALDLRLLPDPDSDSDAPASAVGSWGRWRLWVGGLNLTEHVLALPSGTTERQDAVTWYLAPLLQWIADAWTPMLHEQRLPSLVHRALTARTAYLSVATTQLGDAAFEPWQAWASRHSLRWAAQGGLLPDVFLRRLRDEIEISWGDRWQPGGEAVEFVLEPGVSHALVTDVAAALDGALGWARSSVALRHYAWHTRLKDAIGRRPSVNERHRFLSWYLDGQAEPGRLSGLLASALRRVGRSLGDLSQSEADHRALCGLAPAVAMFGALSPRISDEATVALLAALAAARVTTGAVPAIDRFVEEIPAWRAAQPWGDGYRLALNLLEDLQLQPTAGAVEIEDILSGLGVRTVNSRLAQDGPLGVALAGPSVCPTILVNDDHPMNRGPAGRRFTLAHELCHLLYDRDQARQLTHASTPWAPTAVEQRANAFAAMLLMPPIRVRQALGAVGNSVVLPDVIELARTLEVGVRAATRHLANIDVITVEERDRLLDELSDRSSSREPGGTGVQG